MLADICVLGLGMTKTEAARLAFAEACKVAGSDTITEENAALSVAREFLPPFALAVLDKTAEPTAEYWEWLQVSTETAQAEHDAAVRAGHGWYQEG